MYIDLLINSQFEFAKFASFKGAHPRTECSFVPINSLSTDFFPGLCPKDSSWSLSFAIAGIKSEDFSGY